MKKLVIMMMFLAFVGANLAIASDDVMTFENTKGTITFNHKAHQEKLAGDCSKCHAGTPGKFGVNKDFGHNTCKACHKEMNGPTKCDGCHKK